MPTREPRIEREARPAPGAGRAPLLEACFANRARMREGTDDADAVSKVQQALADLGYAVGGIDGVFGPKTAAAVRAFKAHESLGSTQFGDVGPGTIRRLDQLFPSDGPGPAPSGAGAQKWPVEDRPTWNQVFEIALQGAAGRGGLSVRAKAALAATVGDAAIPLFRRRVDVLGDAKVAVAADIEAQRLLSIEYAPRSVSGAASPWVRWFDSALQTTCAQFKDPREPVRAAAALADEAMGQSGQLSPALWRTYMDALKGRGGDP